MKIVICDDDTKVTDDLIQILKKEKLEPTVYHDPTIFLKDKKIYDVIFLDIDMPHMNGIEVGNHIRKENTHTAIIYITNLSEYRPMAFGVHAFDYIEKPITESKIRQVLSDLKDYQKPETVVPTIAFKTKEGIIRLSASDILYFEFLNRKVYLHSIRQTFVLISNLYTIQEAMTPYHFASPHKSFCVNLYHVRLIKGYDIYMSNDDVIPLSQKKSSDFRASLNRYLSLCLHGGEW